MTLLRIARRWPVVLFWGGLAAFGGCSSGTQQGLLNSHLDAQGNSIPGWLTTPTGPSLHSQSATQEFSATGSIGCAECHGSDMTGGISRVSCLTSACHHDTPVTNFPAPAVHGTDAKKAPGNSGFASCQICHGVDFSKIFGTKGRCADCHGVSAPHPRKPWRQAGADNTHADVDPANAPVCARCHFPGSPANPPDHPSTPAAAGTPPGCFNNTLCHGEAPNHDVPFDNATHFQATTATFSFDCGNCHAQIGTSPVASAPLCTACHTNAAVSPLTTKDCTSCHGNPPSANAYPNVAGAHATHLGLNVAGTPVTCSTCHNGLESGTRAHYDRANARPGRNALRVPPGDVTFQATYDAKTGASSFDNVALRCSNVSCHGGQPAPNWQTVTIEVNVQCGLCHEAGTAQFNSYSSGKLIGDVTLHVFHIVNKGVFCTACHNTAVLETAHFNALSTPAMEGPASATIGGPGTFIPAGNYDPAGSKSCTPTCHGANTWL